MKKLVTVLTAMFVSVGFSGMVLAADAAAPQSAADAKHHESCKKQAEAAGHKAAKADEFIKHCMKKGATKEAPKPAK